MNTGKDSFTDEKTGKTFYMNTGRYFYTDLKTGRRFCIEPISARNEKIEDKTWTNGGIDQVKGGSISEEDSIITEENGFKNITYIPAGMSPDSFIEQLIEEGKL
jgi:hypothetical protein